MILFKKYHIPLILDLTKDITRREGKKRWNIGSFHQLKTGFRRDLVFAGARIDDVYEEKLGDISSQHVLREGYETKREYFEVYRRINKLVLVNLDRLVWVIEFTVMGLMEIKRKHDDRVIGLIEYDDPVLELLHGSGVFKSKLFGIRPINVSPSDKYIGEELRKWQKSS